MALGTPTSLGTNAQASASASTSTLTTTGAAPADSTVVVCLGHSSAGNPLQPTITDDQGGTYTVASFVHGATQITTTIAYRYCPSGLISGAVITASYGATQTAARFTHASYMTGNGKPDRTASTDRSSASFNTYLCGTSAATSDAGQAIGVWVNANGGTAGNATGSSPAGTVHVTTAVSSKGFGVIRSAPGAGVAVTITGQFTPLVTTSSVGILVHFVSAPARVTETDTAGAIGVYRHGIGQAVETDTAGRTSPLAVSPGDLGPLTAVGSSSATAAGTTLTYTLDSDVPANSTIVLAGASGAGGAPFKVSDSSGLLRWWTARRAEQTGVSPCGAQIAFAYARQRIPAGTVITITTGSVNTARYIAVSYFTGQGVPDRSAGATGTGTAWSTGATPATGSFRELVVTAAHLLDSGTTTDTSSPGQDVVQNILGSASRRLVVRSTRGVVPATAVTGSGVWSVSGTWAAATVTFRAVSPGEPRYPAKRTSLSPDHTWLLDDPSGTVADDSVGVADGTYVNTPTLANAGMIEDSTASVATTAAQSEDITLPISLGNSFTFEAWIEDLALATAALRDNTSSNGTILALLSSAIISIRIGGTTVSTGVSERALRGKHHHVFTKSGTTVVWYVDGQAVFTGSSFPSSHSSTSPFHLSRNGTVANFETAGWDDVSTYPAALTADEVRDLFAAAVSYRYPVNPATETDTAGTIRRVFFVAQALETDTARRLAVPIRRASETDTAGAITDSNAATANQASETDTARRLAVPIGRAAETDTAGSLTAVRARAIGQASETDTAQIVTPRQGTPIAQASETDTAGTLNRIVRRASETDTARSLSRYIGQATETDTARTIRDVVVLGRASETDTARPITAIWFPLVDQAQETDSAGTVVRLLITRAEETDSAGAWARLLVNQALETDTAQTVLPTLTLHPEFIELDPALDSQVFDPALIRNQTLEPEPFAPPAATVFGPALSAGQPLEPDTLSSALTPTVYDPTLIGGQFLEPDTLIGGLTPTVFSPALIPGEFLEPDTLTGGLSPIVPSPALIRGQLVSPDTLTSGLSPTVYDPELAHGQPIYPDELDPALSITVYEPALANTQQLVVGDPYVNPEPTVFDPALAQREPSVIVVGEANQIIRSVLREAR